MKDENKAKDQLISEIEEMRLKISELEIVETEQKQAERKIADLGRFPSENPNPVLYISNDGVILYSNKASASLLKSWQYQEGEPIADKLHQVVRNALESGVSQQAEVQCDKIIWSFWFAPVAESNHVNAYGFDITGRKRAEEALGSSEAYLKRILNGMIETLVVVDRNYKILDANRCFLEQYKVNHDEVIGKFCYEISHGSTVPCFQTGYTCPVKIGFESGRRSRVEHTHVDSKGGKYIVEISAFPLLSPTGEVENVVEVSHDITERRAAEEIAKVQQQQLVQADRLASLGVLLAGMAHEINNPNQTILSNSTLVAEGWRSISPILERYYEKSGDFLVGGRNYTEMREEIPGYLLRITEGAQTIRGIVNDLKDFSRQEPFEDNVGVDVSRMMRSAVTLSMNMITNVTKNFKAEYGEGLPIIKGSFQRLEQVAINLLQNACQAVRSREEAICVRTWYDEGAREVCISVRDEGGGMTEESISKAKDPFFTTRRADGGTGLGLSVSSSIVKDHGGQLKFTSVVGKGTTVTVTLPVGDL